MPDARAPIRPPAVAGRFYPAAADELTAAVSTYLQASGATPQPAVAVMVPHAGYVYSGAVAGHVFAAVEVPSRVIILCPNHTGRGPRVAVAQAHAWQIPGADVAIDRALADEILAACPLAEPDDEAHRFEHAIEVELPFLIARQPQVQIVPIVLGGLSATEAISLGDALWRVCRQYAPEVLLVASSDMSHYLPDSEARRVDRDALSPLLSFDPHGLHETVTQRNISMCGFIPATAMLAYARASGATRPELVAYATSGDAFGDTSQVVGYAGVVVR